MQKIIVASNARKLNIKAVDFAAYLAALTKSRLTGFFIQNRVHGETPALKTPFALPYVETITADAEDTDEEMEQMENAIETFENACIERDVAFFVEPIKGNKDSIIVEESRFSDVIVLSADTSFEDTPEAVPTAFVKNALGACECPVIIAPDVFDEINEIVFAYDGGKSCVHAIKQFTYLFPQYYNTPLTLLQVTGENEEVENSNKIKAWLKTHYCRIFQQKLTGTATDELFMQMLQQRNKFLVMGSFGRSPISQFFKPSTAHILVKTINLPLFVAHTK